MQTEELFYPITRAHEPVFDEMSIMTVDKEIHPPLISE